MHKEDATVLADPVTEKKYIYQVNTAGNALIEYQQMI